MRRVYPYRRYLSLISISFLLLLFFIYSHANNPKFGNQIDLGLIENNEIDEASGLAASRKNPGVLWTHNDSGDKNRIFAFNFKGQHLGEYKIGFIPNRDLEDMAVGPGPDDNEQYIFLGDIGDNAAKYYIKYIYRIPEPTVDSCQIPVDTILSEFDVIAFRYPDGDRDSETLMVDPITKDIFVVSKRDDSVRVYRAPYPQTCSEVTVLEYITSVNIMGVTGGDISPTGSEILLKTYTNIYYWRRELSQSIGQALTAAPQILPYLPEPQGEAISWASDTSGYYTLSEERYAIPAHLYFYPRVHLNPEN